MSLLLLIALALRPASAAEPVPDPEGWNLAVCGAPGAEFDPGTLENESGLRFEIPPASVLNSNRCIVASYLTIRPYAALGFPAEFTKTRLVATLQRFVDEEGGKAFHLLGDPDDFFHGHFLSIDGRLVGVIYHTQEHNFPPFRFDEPNRKWLQWFDASKPIENAWDDEDGTKWIGPGTAWGQFSFLRVQCKTMPAEITPDDNLIELNYFGERYCLVLLTQI